MSVRQKTRNHTVLFSTFVSKIKRKQVVFLWSCFDAETSFRAGKTVLDKGPKAKRLTKKLFLGFFEASKSTVLVPGGWQLVGGLLRQQGRSWHNRGIV